MSSTARELSAFWNDLFVLQKSVPVLALLTISAGYIYEFCYFQTLGASFYGLLSVTDVLKLSIPFVPVWIGFTFLQTGFFRFNFDPYASKVSFWASLHERRGSYLLLLSLPLIVSISLGLFLTQTFLSFSLYILPVVMLFVSNFLVFPKFVRARAAPVVFAFFFVISLAYFANLIARVDLRKDKTNAELATSLQSSIMAPIILLHVVERGVIFRRSDRADVSFVSWDDVKELRVKSSYPADRTLIQRAAKWVEKRYRQP